MRCSIDDDTDCHPDLGGDEQNLAQDDDEDVVISLCSKDPQACKGVVRFDYTKGEYVPLKLT